VFLIRLFNPKSRLITEIEKKFSKKVITVQFKNIRDNYSYFINQKKVYENIRHFQGEEEFKFFENYTTVDEKPEFLKIPTEKINFPRMSGGDGNRCRLKGVFSGEKILNTGVDTNHYIFFEEYEMHCLTAHSDKIRNICKICDNCQAILRLMKSGKYADPPKKNEDDHIILEQRGERYIILNGNHRVCCAKTFGISFVGAEVCKNKHVEQTLIKYLNKKTANNKEVLETFYKVFDKKGINMLDVHNYLENDGTDIGLIELLRII